MNNLLTPADVGLILRIKPETVTKMLRSGELQGLKVGSRWRIKPSVLDIFIEAHAVKGIEEG